MGVLRQSVEPEVFRHSCVSAGATSETSEPYCNILLPLHPVTVVSTLFNRINIPIRPFCHLTFPSAKPLSGKPTPPLAQACEEDPRGEPHPSLRLARPERHVTLSAKGSWPGPYAIETGAIPRRDCPLMVGCGVDRTAIQRHGCLLCQCGQGTVQLHSTTR